MPSRNHNPHHRRNNHRTTYMIIGIIGALIIFTLVLSRACTAQVADYFRVDPWQYWAATPAYMKMCNQAGHCYSNITSSVDSHILGYQDNGIYGVLVKLPSGAVGVTRDYVGGQLRCFSANPGTCLPLPAYPPGYSPIDYVPVLSPLSLGTITPTPGAKLVFAAQSFAVNVVDTTTCAVAYSGGIVQTGAHFVLSSYDFGPGVGVLSNVYVTEYYSGIPAGSVDPRYGVRMERYFYTLEYGRARQEGWTDPTCTSDPATCLGNYTVGDVGGPTTWVPSMVPPPVQPVVGEICP